MKWKALIRSTHATKHMNKIKGNWNESIIILIGREKKENPKHTSSACENHHRSVADVNGWEDKVSIKTVAPFLPNKVYYTCKNNV